MTTDKVLNGRYDVGALIGRGGMADVHLGRDIRLGRSVAIKVLRRDLARDPLFQSRFRREAQAVAALNHPAIVSVYDTGEEEVTGSSADEVRVPFIVMEYVAGRTLRDMIRAGDLTLEESIEHAVGVLSALEYSHKAGIVHRDIKPANVMITPDGNVKVMDFGIARAMADSAATMTQTQAVMGTAQYLSPEQARGETVDARSDLYSAGCLLYELLTGRPPFLGDSPVSVAYQHVREAPRPARDYNPDISPALDSVLTRALAKDRENRFQDAASFRAALQDARRGIVLAGNAGHDATEIMARVPTADRPARVDADPQTRSMAKVLAGGTPSFGTAAADDTDGGLPAALAVANNDGDHKRSRRPGWLVLFFIVLTLTLAAVAFLLYNLMNSPSEPAAMTDVPAVDGLSRDEAANTIFQAGLRPSVEARIHDSVESGLVIGSDPGAGAEVEPGSTVTLRISQGPSSVVIPESLAGLTESSAREELLSAGLRGGEVTEENSASVPQGRVITTVPTMGESIPVGTDADIVLSNGQVEVPQLTGLTQEEAIAALEDPDRQLDFEVEEDRNPDVEPGLITGQSVEGGQTVEQGTEITISVAVEPEDSDRSEDSEENGRSDNEDSDGNDRQSESESTPTPTEISTDDSNDDDDS